jgi:hypothetical protein
VVKININPACAQSPERTLQVIAHSALRYPAGVHIRAGRRHVGMAALGGQNHPIAFAAAL